MQHLVPVPQIVSLVVHKVRFGSIDAKLHSIVWLTEFIVKLTLCKSNGTHAYEEVYIAPFFHSLAQHYPISYPVQVSDVVLNEHGAPEF